MIAAKLGGMDGPYAGFLQALEVLHSHQLRKTSPFIKPGRPPRFWDEAPWPLEEPSPRAGLSSLLKERRETL